MALGTYVAGAATATYDATALGQTQEGYEIQYEPKADMINRSDIYGDTMLDIIFRGADVFAQMEFIEYKAGPLAVAFPWASQGALGLIGRLGSDVAKALVFTAVAGTPAALVPATLTASKAILAPNGNPRFSINSRLRTIPLRMVLLPYDSSGIKHYTTT